MIKKVLFLFVALFCLLSCDKSNIVEYSRNDNSKQVLSMVKKRVNINTRDTNGNTALIWALRNDNDELAIELIDNGANINISNENGIRPINIAIQNQDIKIINLLIENKVNLITKDKNGSYPLFYAIDTYNFEIIKTIYKYSDSINELLIIEKIKQLKPNSLGIKLLKELKISNNDNLIAEEEAFENNDPTVHYYGINKSFMTINGIRSVELTLYYDDSPSILILSSNESVTWNIITKNNSFIERVIVFGNQESSVKGIDKKKIENNSKSKKHELKVNYIKNRSECNYLVTKIKEIYGYKLKSVQSEENVTKISIDGRKSIKLFDRLKRNSSKKERVMFEHESHGRGTISSDGLTVSGYMLMVNQGYIEGKWYFEASPTILISHKDTFSRSNVGITTSTYGGFSAPIGGSYGYSYTATRGNFLNHRNLIIDFDKLTSEDIIGVAIDLDNSKILVK